MNYVLCLGEALVDFIAQINVPDIGASELFRRSPGGAVSNVAVGIARLGENARFAGTVSKDPFGSFLLRTLARENVDVDNVRLVDAATTLAFVARGERGARDFFFLREPGADSLLATSDLVEEQIKGAAIFHFGGVLLASEPARSTSLVAARWAREAGALVSFDPNARPALFASAEEMRAALREGCSVAHLVKLSDEDLVAMGMPPDDARPLLEGATEAVALTRGAAGGSWLTKDGASGSVTSPRVEAVDSTGAGDAATAGVLHCLALALRRNGAERASAVRSALRAENLEEALRYGCAAGAIACLTEGAIPSLPTASAVEAMLSRSA